MKKIIIVLTFVLYSLTGDAQPPNFSEFKESKFLFNSWELATAANLNYKIPISIIMAVSILESGYGKSYSAKIRKNYFGYNKGKKVYFSAFESYKDFCLLLSTAKRYKPLFLDPNANFRDWSAGLVACGYNNSSDYSDKINKIIIQYKLNEL
jgi:flagellum-specific peptidoglycan hydrolase FlgJ